MGINHAISVMVLAMASQAKPASVFATNLDATVRGFEAPPIWNIQVRFDTGTTGFCFGNIDVGNGYDAYHNLYGTEGALVFDSLLERPLKVRYWSKSRTAGKWVHPLDSQRCPPELVWPANTTTPDSGNVVEHQTAACVGHFLECIQTGKPSPLSFVNSAAIAEIGWAAQISALRGQPVALPLDWNEARKVLG
jgi:predicted dehydrogenase